MSTDYDPDAILADPTAHPIHKMYAEINIGVPTAENRTCTREFAASLDEGRY